MAMELLKAGAKEMGLSLDQTRLDAFELYFQELTAWNQKFNLTAITEYADVQCQHFVDSLACLLAIPCDEDDQGVHDTIPVRTRSMELQCIDIGSGAGFPGLPLKIAHPELKLTLLESTGKKVTFLRHMASALKLQGVTFIEGRAEEAAHDEQHRERYDIAVARAVARMSTLAEYCLPFCRIGGRFVAQKGMDIEQELEEAERAIKVFGGKIIDVKKVEVPGLHEARSLVIIGKVKPTPDEYPRRTGVPGKHPLTD